MNGPRSSTEEEIARITAAAEAKRADDAKREVEIRRDDRDRQRLQRALDLVIDGAANRRKPETNGYRIRVRPRAWAKAIHKLGIEGRRWDAEWPTDPKTFDSCIDDTNLGNDQSHGFDAGRALLRAAYGGATLGSIEKHVSALFDRIGTGEGDPKRWTKHTRLQDTAFFTRTFFQHFARNFDYVRASCNGWMTHEERRLRERGEWRPKGPTSSTAAKLNLFFVVGPGRTALRNLLERDLAGMRQQLGDLCQVFVDDSPRDWDLTPSTLKQLGRSRREWHRFQIEHGSAYRLWVDPEGSKGRRMLLVEMRSLPCLVITTNPAHGEEVVVQIPKSIYRDAEGRQGLISTTADVFEHDRIAELIRAAGSTIDDAVGIAKRCGKEVRERLGNLRELPFVVPASSPPHHGQTRSASGDAAVLGSPSEPELDDADKNILQAMREARATSEATRRSSKEIAQLVYGSATRQASGANKNRLRQLVKRGYLKLNNSTGRNSGYWLVRDE